MPKAALAGGRPQGLFVGVSMLSGNPVFLLFLDQGRVYHNMPRGGMNQVDWAALLADNPDICGRWSMNGSELRIEWNDGNVWEGPLEVTSTGIRFYGKSYGKALPVSQQEMVGVWEGVRSTAWLNLGSGPATTQVNSLTVDAAGNFLFGAALGSNVEGATSYSESSQQGRLTIDGYDAIFQAADSSEMRMSIVRLADGGGVILDGTYFVRQ